MAPEARPARRLLGVDVGERRIGVAVSEGRIAVPLTIIEHENRAKDLARVVEIAQREQVAAIIVGLAVSLSGEEHEQARITRRFGDQLREHTGVPVIFQDESYSSIRAETAIEEVIPSKPGRQAPSKRSRRERHYDDRAAAVILQSYIDSRGDAQESGA
jgi:putative Holliday junction resolvase